MKLFSKLSLIKSSLYFLRQAYADALRLAQNPFEGAKLVYGVSLYRNAIYLMINSGAAAVFGFFFWFLVARLYPPQDVGLGSALLSAAALLSFIGTLGLGFGIIRFLPASKDKAALLNLSFAISLLASLIVTLIFLYGLSFWSPKLIFVRGNPFFFASFVLFVAAATLSEVLSSVFIGLRRAEFTLVQGIITGLVRLLLVVALAAFFGVFGIFASWGIAVAVAFGVLLFFLPRLLPGYRLLPPFRFASPSPSSDPRSSTLSELACFSFANHMGVVLGSLPGWVLPLMVLNMAGPEANAYFYISWMMAGLLLAIPAITSISFFAEGSYEEGRVGIELKRSLKLIALLLFPAVLIFLLVGDKILLFFGRGYSEAGTHLLWLLAPASVPASVNMLYLGVLRVERKLKEIIIISGVIAFGVLLLSYLFLSWLGILGVGVGWLAAQTVVALAVTLKLVKRLK